MNIHHILLGVSVIMIVNGHPWRERKNKPMEKLSSMIQNSGENNLVDQLNLIIDTLNSNEPNMMDLQKKLWNEDKDKVNVGHSDKTSHALALFLTYNPLPSCQEKYLINMEQFISCVKEIEENIQNEDISKRSKELMKFNPPGWKRKRRDALQTERDREQEKYDPSILFNRLLLNKRQKMRFNPPGW